MKKTYLTFVIIITFFFTSIYTVQSQTVYQLPNAGFEQWDGGNESEPTHWNTFGTSDGSYASLASSNHHYRRPGHRTGGNGDYYLTIYTKSIIGVKANGNMTTGRIHAGSTSASSSSNYNYTQRSNSDHCQPFTATPDSMYVWVSFYAGSSGSVAQISAIIHGDNDFKSPNNEDQTELYTGRAVAQTSRTTTSASQMNWQQVKVPFVYDGTAQPAYILVSLTTNKTAGAGDKNDSLSIDDIEFIYSAWLTDISIDGTTVDGFEKGRFNYTIHVDDIADFGVDNISYTSEVEDVNVERSITEIDDTTIIISLSVTAEDEVTQKTYNITATSGMPGQTVAIKDIDSHKVLLFPNPAKEHITVNCDGLLELTNMRGLTVLHRRCNSGDIVDISNLPHGVYTASIAGHIIRIVH